MSQKTCKECGARCCKYFAFEIDKPTSYQEFENIRWYLAHKDVTVHIDVEGDWYIAISNRCNNLDRNNRCKDYKNRPLICRTYNVGSCDFEQGDYEYLALFTKPEQIQEYARKKLGPARYKRIEASARAKAGKPSGSAPKARRTQGKKKRPPRKPPLSDLFAF